MNGKMLKVSQIILASELLASKVAEDTSIVSVSTNSKKAVRQSLFIAIKGTQFDSHTLVRELSGQNVYCMVEDPEIYDKFPGTLLVPSTRKLVGPIASRFNGEPSEKFNLVGVTGTNGKTTTAFLLDQLWSGMGKTTAMVGTIETKIANDRLGATLTTPGPEDLQLLYHRMTEKRVEHCVIEVSSIALDQYRVAGSAFDIGVFTNFSRDHLDYHHTMEEYLNAKLKFFSEYSLSAVVVNIDSPVSERFLSITTAPLKLKFSVSNPQADFYALNPKFTMQGISTEIKTPEGKFVLRSKLLGRHNLLNCLGVVAVAYAEKLDMNAVLKALESATGAPGRLERISADAKNPSIFVDYAHSDDALDNVLKVLTEFNSEGAGRIFTVFGCGGDRDRLKRPKMAEVVCRYSHVVVATSDNPRNEDPEQILNDIEQGISRQSVQYHREVNRRKAIEWTLQQATAKDIVLVAGKGHETYQIIGSEKLDFDDRQVIRDYYQ